MNIKIYYDKECPFCNKYTKIININKKHNLNILNARENKEEIENLRKKNFDINNGIIVQVEDFILYQGVEAIKFLDRLEENKNLFKRFYSFIINRDIFKKFLYPIIKYIRVLILKIVGKNPTI